MATMSTVWDRTAAFLGDNLTALLPIALLTIFVPLSLLGSLMPMMGSGTQAGDWAVGAAVLAMALTTSWGGIAITALAFDPAAGRGSAVRTANRRLLPVAGIGLVTLLAVIVLSAPVGIALALGGIDPAAVSGGGPAAVAAGNGAVAFATLYALALLVVLVWGYARLLLLVTPIMVVERRGLGVYARAFALTRGIAGKAIGVVLLYGLVSWTAAAAARSVFGSLFALLLPGGTGRLGVAGVLTQTVVAGVSTIFSVLAAAFVAKLYLATRDAREAIVPAS